MVRNRAVKARVVAAVLLVFAVLAVPAAAGETQKTDDGKKAPAQQAAAAKSTTPAGGVVLRPKDVDGSVSAYAAAVRKPDPEVKVYTNADLESMWAGDPSAWATAPSTGGGAESGAETTPAAAPLEWMETQAAEAQARAKAVADAESELSQANAEVANLEKQLRAVTNPYAARPQLGDEEQAARAKGETPVERQRRTQEQLEEARKRAQAAQARLEQARRPR